MELVSKGTGCYYIAMTPDAQWLSDESRVYPVVIDPQVTTDTTRTNIIDNYVLKGAGNQNRNLDRLYIGNRSEGLTRAFIKFDTMPTLPANATITAANMTVWITSGTNTGYTANAYKVTGGDWESGTITWANQPAASTLLASNISHNSLTKYSFSCLSAVQSWYSGSTTGQNANYGIMMRYTSESTDDYNAFYSADHTEESKRPSITITYTTPSSGVDVDVGSTRTLSTSGITGTITWASSDTSVVTVNSSGKITGVKAGSATVTASVGGVVQREYTIYVTIVDGVYYMKSSTGLYMSVDGGLTDGTPVKMLSQATQEDAKLRQLWKIQYVDAGYYYIRSLYLVTRALRITTNAGNVNTANITTVATNNGPVAATSDCRWMIETNSSGYIFKHRETSTSSSRKCLRTDGTGVVTSHYVSGNSLFTWTLVKDTTVANQVLFINPEDGTTVNNAVRYVTPGEKLTLSDLGFEVSFVSQYTNYQNIQWSSLEPSVAEVDQSTGTVAAVSPGQTTITARRDYNGSPCLRTYTITVLPVPDGVYYIRNRQYGAYLQVDDSDASNSYSTSGEIVEQWHYQSGSYQQWQITSLNNGYYSIISAKSGLALSVPAGETGSADVSLVQEAYAGYDRQKWKITQTEDFCYKIKPKSSEGFSNDLVMAVGYFEGTDSLGVNIEQRVYAEDEYNRDVWQICSFVDIGMSTDDYSGGGKRKRASYLYATTFYNGLLSTSGSPISKTHHYNKDSVHTASIKDFEVNGAMSNDIDFMIYLGHGHDAHVGEEDELSNHKANHIQYSYSICGEEDYSDVCESSKGQDYKESFCLHTDNVTFGAGASDLRWVWMYTCNFLTPVSNAVTNDSLKKMMTGAHILMGYATSAMLCESMVIAFSSQLCAGEPIIDSFFYAGENGESYASDTDHIQKVLYLSQARNETIYSPQIHYEYDSDDVQIITYTFEGRK